MFGQWILKKFQIAWTFLCYRRIFDWLPKYDPHYDIALDHTDYCQISICGGSYISSSSKLSGFYLEKYLTEICTSPIENSKNYINAESIKTNSRTLISINKHPTYNIKSFPKIDSYQVNGKCHSSISHSQSPVWFQSKFK